MTTNTNNSTARNPEDFGKRILAAVPHIYPYLKHRLYIAEASGLIPRNMYKSQGLLDDAIVNLYDSEQDLNDDLKLKLKLFSLVDQRLDELYKTESFHRNTMSTSDILKKELNSLEEKFFMDADEDTLMSDELDDISYHQQDQQKDVFLYDDAEKNIIRTLELSNSERDLDKSERLLLNKIYTWLPRKTSNVLDLYVFGKMSVDEIAEIKEVDPEEIHQLMRAVRKSFRKNLG
ncbi:hypothetical protein E7Z59_09570 [Robertkochia marina]|uniref:Sigma-70 family RNA polymerase sigma factor n=1 Tax=Robertkochia marina TaxID=1227945 RepID=A0A4S3M129_9FLAO|nr:hypothetical protein [Robertkochia marina]THD67888.1 hypothetical protein E7Z59_09570 [Robertkochia marina]TRZ42073.1 hypothetical protein D3A96_12145 [Robertkochia marina]